MPGCTLCVVLFFFSKIERNKSSHKRERSTNSKAAGVAHVDEPKTRDG